MRVDLLTYEGKVVLGVAVQSVRHPGQGAEEAQEATFGNKNKKSGKRS